MSSALRLLNQHPAVQRGSPVRIHAKGWCLTALQGRLIECSGTAQLTVALRLVHEAQEQDEPVVWLTLPHSFFFPPDAAALGIDLQALIVVRVPNAATAIRVSDRLVRSGSFGLLIADLGSDKAVPLPLLSRIAKLASQHDTAVLCLTEKSRAAPSLGALVSLRVDARRHLAPHGGGERMLKIQIEAIKDRRGRPGLLDEEVCRAAPGLR